MNAKALRCLDSWKKMCPDYEIIRWDEQNARIGECRYAVEAYQAKKWAFVSDYVRLKSICVQGGIYLDTDVELLKPLEPLLANLAFMGFESKEKISTGLMAAESGHSFFREAARRYEDLQFLCPNGTLDCTTNVERITKWLLDLGLNLDNKTQTVCDVTIYPKDYFSPKDLQTGRVSLSPNTYAVHHFQASWMPLKGRINTKISQMLGPEHTQRIKRLLGKTE